MLEKKHMITAHVVCNNNPSQQFRLDKHLPSHIRFKVDSKTSVAANGSGKRITFIVTTKNDKGILKYVYEIKTSIQIHSISRCKVFTESDQETTRRETASLTPDKLNYSHLQVSHVATTTMSSVLRPTPSSTSYSRRSDESFPSRYYYCPPRPPLLPRHRDQ